MGKTLLSTFIVLLFALPKVHTSCDSSTQGCFPPIFDLLNNFTNFPARSIYASSVCGFNSTAPVEYLSLVSSDVTIYTCQPDKVQPINVVNKDVVSQQTYWQSDLMIESEGASAEPQYIVFNFTDEFLFHGIIITFMAVHKPSSANSADARPAAFSIDKFDLSTHTWTTLEHFARNCSSSFPGVPLYDVYSPDPDFTRVHCVQYVSLDDDGQIDDYINEVEYSPGMRYDNYEYLYQDNINAASRFTVSGLRITIHQPASTSPLKSYVAISDVIIDAQCKCNGHADSCSGQNNAVCDCQHNTSEQQCNSCLPIFNNRHWTIGNTTDPGICHECTCNSRTNSCSFDEIKGHGVCINCAENSTGDACDSCIGDFYINPDYSNTTSPSISNGAVSSGNAGSTGNPYCLACSCDKDGTQSAFLSTCNATSGQCVCKERATLRDCSSCQDTFWGLSAANALGCSVCSCNSSGSLGDKNMCNKTTGECICKTNVEGDVCDICKPYTYSFDSKNPDGCTPCNCDPGASTSKMCDLSSGQCQCYSNIGGRDCRSPLTGYFVPRLDAIILEPEQNTTENITLRSGHGSSKSTFTGRGFFKLTSANKIDINFTSSLTAVVNTVLRFEKTTTDNFIWVQAKLTLKSAVNYNCGEGQTISIGKEWDLTFTASVNNNQGGLNMGEVCLYAGAIYNIQITNPATALLIDSVVFLLDSTLVIPKIGDSLYVDNATRCAQSAVSTVRAGRSSCAEIEYSLAAAILQKPISCSCVGAALASTNCDPHSGDCNCLPGALQPDCTQCMVDYYQFTTQGGCTACGCHVNGSNTDSCDNQGVCQCWQNVQGPKCDSCIPEHSGLYTGSGCTSCQCNMLYSINNNCSDYGQCACQPGVTGLSCDVCMHGYYNLTRSGCTQCDCNQYGSTEQSCDVSTGSCQCLPRAEGSKCSQCKQGYFGLGEWHNEGCISCFCWGHSQNCSSMIGWLDTPITSKWPNTGPNPPAEIWLAEFTNGTKVNVLTPLATSGSLLQYALRIDEAQRASSDIFFIAPNKFLGNRKSSYGRYLRITLMPSPLPSSLSPEADKVTVNVTLTGKFSNVTLTYTYNSNLTSSSEIVINIPIQENYWKATTTPVAENETLITYNTAAYNQVMEILSDLSSLKILSYHGNVSNSALDLLNVTLDSAVDGSPTSNPTGLAVNNIELCSCEVGYMGSSCEQCALNYTRAITNSTNPGSQCVPCSCNGHGLAQCTESAANCTVDLARSCDQLSGVCRCQHNTEGDHCQSCLPGYYGNPMKGTKDDCLPCGCPGIVVSNETNVFSTSCSQSGTDEPICIDCQKGHTGNHCELCIDGYFGTPENATNFGGSCRQCECSDHADTCNTRTGECVACRNNTAGNNCEICAPGYFGDAINSTCQPCSCNFTGSTGQCDHVTGVCVCLSNVSGSQCDVCNDETFNLTAEVGCQPCNCFMNGSNSSICDKTTGQCVCTKLVTGQSCDKCLPSYWNVNQVTGCDACQCNTLGTLKDNSATVDTCEVITGQCTCALPGIVGRTCDQCSLASKKTFKHVRLFSVGVFPDCELCGECFDSWAQKIEEVGQQLDQLNQSVHSIWSTYDFQTSEQVNTNLTALEDQVTKMNQSIMNFEGLSSQLIDLRTQFYEALARQDKISSEVDMMAQTEQTLSTTLSTLVALQDSVQVTATTMVALSALRQQFDQLSKDAVANSTQGNSSWIHIQSLIFVVSSHEDRERQILEQVTKLMEMASQINQTLQQTRNLYDTSLTPGATKNAQMLTILLEQAGNVSASLADVRAVITAVQNDISSSNISLTLLIVAAAGARESMLKSVISLQQYVTNASKSQIAAEKLLADVKTFKTVAEKAEQTIVNSTTSLLQSLAILQQAESDLTKALSISMATLLVDIPTQTTLQQIVDQIKGSALSVEGVAKIKMASQQAKYTSDQSAMKSQRALSLSKSLEEEVTLMNSDVVASRNLRLQAQALRLTCDNLNKSIHTVLQEAKNHTDIVIGNVTNVTQSALTMQTEVRNATSCLMQKQLDVMNAVTAANQVKDKADSASSDQVRLLEIMGQINSNSLTDVSQTLSNLTQADSVIRQVNTDIDQLEALAQLEVLIQELQTQTSEISSLDQEVTELTTQLDSIILLLQESSGGTNCVAK